MQRDDWRSVKRLGVFQVGKTIDLTQTELALEQIRRSLPDVDIMFLCSPAVSQYALSWSLISQVMVHGLFADRSDWNASSDWLSLVDLLRSEQLDAALFLAFSNASALASPYPLAYACYLAGIPIRIGQSPEFGGGVLSEWIKEPLKGPQELLTVVGLA